MFPAVFLISQLQGFQKNQRLSRGKVSEIFRLLKLLWLSGVLAWIHFYEIPSSGRSEDSVQHIGISSDGAGSIFPGEHLVESFDIRCSHMGNPVAFKIRKNFFAKQLFISHVRSGRKVFSLIFKPLTGKFLKKHMGICRHMTVLQSVLQIQCVFQGFPFLLPGRSGLVYGTGEMLGASMSLLIIPQTDDNAVDNPPVFVCDSFQ